MKVAVPVISSSQVADLANQLNEQGYACIPNYLGQQDLSRMQKFVDDAVEKSGREYVHFNGPKAVNGSGLDELGQTIEFRRLMYALYEQGTGKAAEKEDFYQVLRCLSGASGQKNSLIFHYDSFVVTALIPICIPSEGLAGDLLLYPNTRNIRRTYLANVVDKVLLDNQLTQKVLRSRVNGKLLAPTRLKMLPGNLYFFWGYRTVHTNEPCDPDKVRATAVFHYKNPHRKFVNNN